MDFDDDGRVVLAQNWQADIAARVRATDWRERASLAAALQTRIGDLFSEFLTRLRQRLTVRPHLCLGGSFFRNSYLNAKIKLTAGFDGVFVPIDPTNAGLSVGAALHLSGNARRPVSPFLGPSYTSEEIKETLDNCKLTYDLTSDTEVIAIAAEALAKGRFVAWFDGAMEWGPRALGARSILANPFAPYVLDNLNHFLKQREVWHGYPLSTLDSAISEHFEGPENAPFMECDFVPRDRERFRHILTGPNATLRVQTVASDDPPRFRELLRVFGEKAGVPVLVNTSFNGFREPIVCSPRDAIRVFFGTGIDILVLDRFVIRK
jgi:carbamoyltransferase